MWNSVEVLNFNQWLTFGHEVCDVPVRHYEAYWKLPERAANTDQTASFTLFSALLKLQEDYKSKTVQKINFIIQNSCTVIGPAENLLEESN